MHFCSNKTAMTIFDIKLFCCHQQNNNNSIAARKRSSFFSLMLFCLAVLVFRCQYVISLVFIKYFSFYPVYAFSVQSRVTTRPHFHVYCAVTDVGCWIQHRNVHQFNWTAHVIFCTLDKIASHYNFSPHFIWMQPIVK